MIIPFSTHCNSVPYWYNACGVHTVHVETPRESVTYVTMYCSTRICGNFHEVYFNAKHCETDTPVVPVELIHSPPMKQKDAIRDICIYQRERLKERHRHIYPMSIKISLQSVPLGRSFHRLRA